MNKITNKTQEKDLKQDLLTKLDAFFKKNENSVFYISLFFTILFSLLLFDPKVSAGGDDSAYVIRAFKFIKEFKFPTFQGPLYPIILSPFVAIFGIQIKLLKGLSLIFMIGHLFFFHKTFKDRIPATLHASALLIISLSSSYLYFSYQTYVEAFYLFVQSIGIWIFVKYFIDGEEHKFNLKTDYKKYLYLGLVILVMGLTRSVGYATIGVVIIFFMVYKKWQAILPTVASFGILYILYSMLRRLIWGIHGADFSGQGKGLMYKNYYSHAEGKEDLAGFLQRFIDNSNLYLSKHLYIFMGVRKETVPMTVIPWLTIFTYALFIVAIIFVIRKNKYLFLASVYTGVLCFITFLIIQKSWDQARLIIPYYPMILLVLLASIYYVLKKISNNILKLTLPVIVIIILFSSFKVCALKSKKNSELKGPWYGQTPDWINYIKCSKWCAKGLPKNAVIGSRKPGISFMYSGGRNFEGIYKFPTLNSAEILNNMKDSVYIISPLNEIYSKIKDNNFQFYFKQHLSFVINNKGLRVEHAN